MSMVRVAWWLMQGFHYLGLPVGTASIKHLQFMLLYILSPVNNEAVLLQTTVEDHM